MIQLSDHFNYKHLLRFTMPSIIMLIFTSVYGVVDGFFVSNFVGKTAFTAVNFVIPVLLILGCVGFMFGTGGGALIALTMGSGRKDKANELFSLLVYASVICGLILTIAGFLFLRPLLSLLGAEGQLLKDCMEYSRLILLAIPAYILQYEFQCLFATAEKPKLGLYVTVAAGLTNAALDALFIAVFHWGLWGAAAATSIGQCVGGIIPVIYFARPNSSLLRLTRTKFDGSALLKVCINGSSELMSNISSSVVSMLYNIQLLKYAGEDGVAAYGVLMYVNMIFLAVYIGFSVGAAPVIGYHSGAGNYDELKGLLKKSIIITSGFAILMFAASQVLARPLSVMFVGYDGELLSMTLHAFFIFAFSFLFAGFAIFGSAFFTALGDGLTSALISFLRALVFQVAAVLLLPLIWGLNGIWFSIVTAEIAAVIVSTLFLAGKRKKYHY
ncbi:MAG: MATE family efflux transporter [Lachnospiraceae bacterium]|nr:MATE family efflux transporter [Lachnospiraceae bacterium]